MQAVPIVSDVAGPGGFMVCKARVISALDQAAVRVK